MRNVYECQRRAESAPPAVNRADRSATSRVVSGHWFTWQAMIAILAVMAGCHGASMPVPTAVSAIDGHPFGDTAAYGLRVTAFDRETERVQIALAHDAHLIVLAVIPGREIELIHPGEDPNGMWRSKKKAGASDISVQRFDDGIRANDADEDAKARLAYERCMQNAAATARRIAESKRVVKRDSTGKIIDDGGRATSDPSMERGLEVQCDRLASGARQRKAPRRLPVRAPADRYLVVLGSQSSLSEAELTVRLATLSAVAPDVATTIEAIAAGLFVGVPGRWSGYYVAW